MGVMPMRRPPDFLQDLRLRHHPPGIAQQQRQQRVFLAGQRNRLAVHAHVAAGQVDMQVTIVEHRHLAFAVGAAAAQQRPHPRHQLLGAERLGHVVVGAIVQGPHLLRLAGAHAEHDHRHLAPLPQLGQHVMAFHVGQADIQHHQVGTVLGQPLQAFGAVGGLADRITLRAQ